MNHQELVEKHMNQVNKIAWSFSRTTGISFEDLQSEGMVTLCHCVGKFAPERGCKLSTLVHISVQRALIGYVGKERANVAPIDEEQPELECKNADHAGRFEFLDILAGLGKTAKIIADIILSGPAEVLDIATDATPCKIRMAIKEHLKDSGFNNNQIDFGINQIKSIL